MKIYLDELLLIPSFFQKGRVGSNDLCRHCHPTLSAIGYFVGYYMGLVVVVACVVVAA